MWTTVREGFFSFLYRDAIFAQRVGRLDTNWVTAGQSRGKDIHGDVLKNVITSVFNVSFSLIPISISPHTLDFIT